MKLGRVALKAGQAYISVDREGRVKLEAAKPDTAQSFQWIETPTGELVLMSLVTNRFLRIDRKTQTIICDSPAHCLTAATACGGCGLWQRNSSD